jgi:hypothetical protein
MPGELFGRDRRGVDWPSLHRHQRVSPSEPQVEIQAGNSIVAPHNRGTVEQIPGGFRMVECLCRNGSLNTWTGKFRGTESLTKVRIPVMQHRSHKSLAYQDRPATGLMARRFARRINAEKHWVP